MRDYHARLRYLLVFRKGKEWMVVKCLTIILGSKLIIVFKIQFV